MRVSADDAIVTASGIILTEIESENIPDDSTWVRGQHMAKEHKFGSCCKDLTDAMNGMLESFFRVEENGILYLTVGYVPTPNGPGWFDQAVLFCPFCGRELQTREAIGRTARSG